MKNRSIVVGLARWSFLRLGQRFKKSAAMLDPISSNQSQQLRKVHFQMRCKPVRIAGLLVHELPPFFD
jgi:hypothetical protein